MASWVLPIRMWISWPWLVLTMFFALIEAMKFGKLLDLNGVDFSLPVDHPQTTRVLHRNLDHSVVPQIYLGATGWGNREWIGRWYPSKSKQNEFLRYYARQFGTIEFNTTHYRVPNPETVARWYELSDPDFRFCPKVPQQISHFQTLNNSEESTDHFLSSIHGLGEKLGPVFLQLPERFAPSRHQAVQDYLNKWPTDLPIGLEFRHHEFFEGGHAAEEVYGELEVTGQGTVITDVAGRRDVLNMRLTNSILILRFVGNGTHPTDYSRADAWAARLKSWVDQGLQAAYLFIHQPDMELVPEYSQYWADAIHKASGIKVRRPELVEEARQGKLF